MRQRGSVAALLVLLMVHPASAAPAKTTVERLVPGGAQTARFTLTKPGEFYWGVKADRPSPLYGFMLTRVGSDPFAVDLVSILGPESRMGVNFMPDGSRGVLMPSGTYELTLFSDSAARLQVAFGGAVPTLHFRSQPLQRWMTASSDAMPTWAHDFPMTLAAVPHGVFVYMHDEWMGDGRSSQTTCVSQAAPCSALNSEVIEQFVGGYDGLPGDHGATYSAGIAGQTFIKGSNTIGVQSIVTGSPTRRGAVVLVVP